MTAVTVTASKSYEILIGSGLLSCIGEKVKSLGNVKKVCIVSDTNVFPLYGAAVSQSLEAKGLEVTSFVFPAGEESKSGETYLRLMNYLAENQMTRSDLIAALGGGVPGDLAGFAAATFLRGIRFLQIPTTLLAAVDSSVGGKTAIDLPAGKNLAGAFHQPSLVICDTDTLNSLPPDIFRDGCAEVIKYGVLYDPQLFAHLEEHGLGFHREAVITRCVELKRDVVALDEFDTGLRMKLNLGHTIGHSVETCSHFAVSHGQAVAIGMAIISRSATAKGLLPQKDCDKLLSLLSAFGLPSFSGFTADELYAHMLSDKKRSGSTIKLIVPRRIGQCDILPVPVEDLKDWIQAGY